MSLPEKLAHVPPFNILAPNAVQRPYTLPIQSSDDTNQISGQDLEDNSGQSSSPRPSHCKRKRQEVPSGGDLKDSLDSRHSKSRTSTKLGA